MIKAIKWTLTCMLIIFLGAICFLMVFRMATAIFIVYTALALILVKRIGNRGFIIFIILGTFLIRLIYICTVNTPLDSDFELLYEAAVLFSQGDYSFGQQVYFQEWAYQTGFVIYQGLVIKIFGQAGSILALKILNCIWNTGITLLIYLIARNFFGKNLPGWPRSSIRGLCSLSRLFRYCPTSISPRSSSCWPCISCWIKGL